MTHSALLLLIADWIVRLVFSFLVITRRKPVGETFAWLGIVLAVPFGGALLYLVLGEVRLGNRRRRMARLFEHQYQTCIQRVAENVHTDWGPEQHDPQMLARLAERNTRIPALDGNRIQLLQDGSAAFASLIRDVQSARERCWLETYIWESGGDADDLATALVDAAHRGVDCRILVDSVGSRAFCRSRLRRDLENAGVQVREALPVGFFRALFYRFDLRLHRKIYLVDHRFAYIGSQNIVDARLFKQRAGVGLWVDAMVRLEGPAVDPLALVFLEDWQLESPDQMEPVDAESVAPRAVSALATAVIQVVPSGPETEDHAIETILLNAIYMADERLEITTPYFVPSEALQTALLSASARGVDVGITIPAHNDSRFVEMASRPFLRELARAGVNIYRFRDGLLHTKSVVVDGDTALFGSINMDPRSMHLNFEITLFVYDSDFCEALLELNAGYRNRSERATELLSEKPSLVATTVESCVRLVSPLL